VRTNGKANAPVGTRHGGHPLIGHCRIQYRMIYTKSPSMSESQMLGEDRDLLNRQLTDLCLFRTSVCSAANFHSLSSIVAFVDPMQSLVVLGGSYM